MKGLDVDTPKGRRVLASLRAQHQAIRRGGEARDHIARERVGVGLLAKRRRLTHTRACRAPRCAGTRRRGSRRTSSPSRSSDDGPEPEPSRGAYELIGAA
jgi:hypothetical protein